MVFFGWESPMQASELAKKIGSKNAPHVIDVRSAWEFRAGHISGALHVPMLSILFRRALLPVNREDLMVLTCEHGPRAQLMKSVLGLAGYRNVVLLDGHMSGWRRAGLPLERS
jgi:rhodanese-related sulfurtransferase